MSSWLAEVLYDFRAIGAIICYLVFSDQQLVAALVDKTNLRRTRLFSSFGPREERVPRLSPPISKSRSQLQPNEVSKGLEVRTLPQTWDLSSSWNTIALRLAALLPLVLALIALGWPTPVTFSEFCLNGLEPLSIRNLTNLKAQPSCCPDLLDADAETLVAGLESGAWTSVDLTKACLHDQT